MEDNPESDVSYNNFLSLVRKMDFIRDEDRLLTDVEEQQLMQIWDIIRDEEHERSCKKHSLKVLLAAIMGFNSKWMFTDHVIQPQDASPLRMQSRAVHLTSNVSGREMRVELGCFIEGLFFLKIEEEAEYIHKTFMPFYINRMNKVHDYKPAQPNSFRPKINRRSKQMVQV